LKRLEAVSAPVEAPRRLHLVAVRTDQECDAAIAGLVAAGAADPGDSFIFLVPGKPEQTSAMHNDYRWDEAAGCWEPKNGRADIHGGPC
jgi:hypothetical protein